VGLLVEASSNGAYVTTVLVCHCMCVYDVFGASDGQPVPHAFAFVFCVYTRSKVCDVDSTDVIVRA